MGYTINDVLTLAHAGFTAGQIAAMTAAAPATPTPAPAAPAPADPLEQILTQLRINALNAAQQPPAQSVDDILAEIINPPAAGK